MVSRRESLVPLARVASYKNNSCVSIRTRVQSTLDREWVDCRVLGPAGAPSTCNRSYYSNINHRPKLADDRGHGEPDCRRPRINPAVPRGTSTLFIRTFGMAIRRESVRLDGYNCTRSGRLASGIQWFEPQTARRSALRTIVFATGPVYRSGCSDHSRHPLFPDVNDVNRFFTRIVLGDSGRGCGSTERGY